MNKYLFLFLSALTLTPTFVFAGTPFIPLVGIPGFQGGTSVTLNTFVNQLFLTCIAIAALLAVVKLVIAGFKYMLTDVVTSKEDAKNDIKGALFGLLVVASTVLILSTINEDITEFSIVNQFGGISISGTPPPTPAPATPQGGAVIPIDKLADILGLDPSVVADNIDFVIDTIDTYDDLNNIGLVDFAFKKYGTTGADKNKLDALLDPVTCTTITGSISGTYSVLSCN